MLLLAVSQILAGLSPNSLLSLCSCVKPYSNNENTDSFSATPQNMDTVLMVLLAKPHRVYKSDEASIPAFSDDCQLVKLVYFQVR